MAKIPLMKEIHFYVDDNLPNKFVFKTWSWTQHQIKIGFPEIHTTSMAHFSMQRYVEGYDIYLHWNQIGLSIYPDMEIPGSSPIDLQDNLLERFMNGDFAKLFYPR